MESGSELTDLSDEYIPTASKKASNKTSYKLKNTLKEPHSGTYAAEMIYRWIHQGRVDLEPE